MQKVGKQIALFMEIKQAQIENLNPEISVSRNFLFLY